MQAMIPLGFMPNLSADNAGTALVICSGADQKTIYLDDQGNTSDHAGISKPCAYATLAFFDAPATPVVVVHEATLLTVAYLTTKSQSFAATSHLLPYAIGPPAVL